LTEIIKGLEIADPKAVFRGLTYGEWAGVWLNHLFSDKPDINYIGGKGMAFLRGNLKYAYTQDPEHPVYSSITQASAMRIKQDTAVFIPVINTKFTIDFEYQGETMKDEISMRNVARRDTVNGGPIGIRIRKKPSNKSYKLVKDLNDFYAESPLFTFIIPENSAYRTFMESPMEAGVYQCVTAGIFVIISHWTPGEYRLAVMGTGVGSYLTRSVYDIVVSEDPSTLLDDISDEIAGGREGETDHLDFMADWNDPKPTKS
jgi:hypothetical protein